MQTPEDMARIRAIPTRVGKSRVTSFMVVICAGHPHAGGEILIAGPIEAITPGPSPRGWGNQN